MLSQPWKINTFLVRNKLDQINLYGWLYKNHSYLLSPAKSFEHTRQTLSVESSLQFSPQKYVTLFNSVDIEWNNLK